MKQLGNSLPLRHALNILSFIQANFKEEPTDLDVPIQCSDGIVFFNTIILSSISPLLKEYLDEIDKSTVKEPLVIFPHNSIREFITLEKYIFSKNVYDAEDLPLLQLSLEALCSSDCDILKWIKEIRTRDVLKQEDSTKTTRRSGRLKRSITTTEKPSKEAKLMETIESSEESEDDSNDEDLTSHVDDDDDDDDLESVIEKKFKRNTTGTGSIACNFCSRRYHHVKARNKHMLSEHLKECCDAGWFFPCQFCSRTFTSQSGRDIHLQRVHPTQKPSEVTPQFGVYVSHILCPFSHQSNQSYFFENLKDLKTHVKENHLDKDLCCIICGVSCISKKDLNEHLQFHSGPESKFLHSCEHCHMRFLSEYAQEAHKREAHSSNKVFTCRFCDKVFRNAKFCRNHEQKHESGEIAEEHRCDFTNEENTVCGRTFSSKQNLERHKKSHTSSKQYSCTFVNPDGSVCGKTFVDSTRLKHHKWIHTGFMPYKCQHCGKGFRHVSHLRNHLVQFHGEEKKFACEICSKKFLYAYQLKTHLAGSHHKARSKKKKKNSSENSQKQEEPKNPVYQCGICKEAFKSYEILQDHNSSKHANEIETNSENLENSQVENATSRSQKTKSGDQQFVIIYDNEVVQ